MPITRVTPKLLVSGQASLAEIAESPGQSVPTLISNRPDAEAPEACGEPGDRP